MGANAQAQGHEDTKRSEESGGLRHIRISAIFTLEARQPGIYVRGSRCAPLGIKRTLVGGHGCFPQADNSNELVVTRSQHAEDMSRPGIPCMYEAILHSCIGGLLPL